MAEFRLRLGYRKADRLRFLSHLEVVRALERGIRRAGLSYAVTAGFNPRMKAAFGPALPVGTGSDEEYLDLWLTRYTAPEEVVRRIGGALPPELGPIEAVYVPDKARALTAGEMLADYEVRVDGEGVATERIAEAVASLVETRSLTIEHKGKTKVFDLSQALPNEPGVEVEKDGSVSVKLTVRIGPSGSLRPDVFVAAALKASGVPARIESVTRTGMVLLAEDESQARPI
jgi:radical SAM-linked protein